MLRPALGPEGEGGTKKEGAEEGGKGGSEGVNGWRTEDGVYGARCDRGHSELTGDGRELEDRPRRTAVLCTAQQSGDPPRRTAVLCTAQQSGCRKQLM